MDHTDQHLEKDRQIHGTDETIVYGTIVEETTEERILIHTFRQQARERPDHEVDPHHHFAGARAVHLVAEKSCFLIEQDRLHHPEDIHPDETKDQDHQFADDPEHRHMCVQELQRSNDRGNIHLMEDVHLREND